MRKVVFLLSLVALLSSCVTNKTYIRDYGERIKLLKANFPEIYSMYCNGAVIIENVYTYEKDGQEKVHISYRYR